MRERWQGAGKRFGGALGAGGGSSRLILLHHNYHCHVGLESGWDRTPGRKLKPYHLL